MRSSFTARNYAKRAMKATATDTKPDLIAQAIAELANLVDDLQHEIKTLRR
jgi:hypothetical protein